MKKILFLLLTLSSALVTAETISVTHKLGNITLESTPKKVVVIGLGALDTLDYFGITPIAVSKGISYPPYLEQYNSDKFASSGTVFEPDFEAIYNMKPDLIVVGIRSSKSYKELSEIAPTLLFAIDEQESYWESTQKQWKNIATVFDLESEVTNTINTLDKQIKEIHNKNTEHKTDALTIMSSGGNITTFGAQSRFASIYQDFGYLETIINVKGSRHGDLVSYEFIQDAQPSTLLIIDRDKLVNKGESKTREQFENPLIKATPAYKNKHMIFLDLNAWYLSIAGVNATKQMIKDLTL
ncbi:siderophore ABC transporter substrate-binding protein [Psychromonas sp. KJ10-10]|uniref:siderophore ABC transporter substrate-binding protein n=1 Tax=Psychromonas sp. KJ10-10 TaxID=3391823 RepID=UPI0039B446CB